MEELNQHAVGLSDIEESDESENEMMHDDQTISLDVAKDRIRATTMNRRGTSTRNHVQLELFLDCKKSFP